MNKFARIIIGSIVTACGLGIMVFAASLLFNLVSAIVFAGFVIFLILGFSVTRLGVAIFKDNKKEIKDSLWFLSFISRRTP